jgi:hypothetical protein
VVASARASRKVLLGILNNDNDKSGVISFAGALGGAVGD